MSEKNKNWKKFWVAELRDQDCSNIGRKQSKTQHGKRRCFHNYAMPWYTLRAAFTARRHGTAKRHGTTRTLSLCRRIVTLYFRLPTQHRQVPQGVFRRIRYTERPRSSGLLHEGYRRANKRIRRFPWSRCRQRLLPDRLRPRLRPRCGTPW